MLTLQFGAYPIYIGSQLYQSDVVIQLCTALHKRLVIVTDTNLMDSYGIALQQLFQAKGVAVELLVFPAGEMYKTRATKQYLEDAMQRKQCGRDTCLLALGGGLVTDLVGFLAATYCRGIPVIYLPTTLLAMVDASMGGKTGVNTPLGKNLIGTFTQPHAVCMDVTTLQTLPEREWRNGLVEMIKHSLIADAALFTKMQASATLQAFQTRADLLYLIQRNCEIKKSIVEQDEREQHMRQLLNFGHTIGHAIETLEDYQIAHGEAVALGILVECYLAVQSGHLSETVLDSVHALLRRYELPLQTKVFQDKALFIQTLVLDKKSLQSIPRFVLLKDVGVPHVLEGVYTHQVAPKHLDQALDWAAERFG
ncbi:MAG: 3-dehydroquinate synthase [Legionellales bacterium]|nr:3-dehydroquinate synthase [Legionellales bacterium]